MRLQVVRPDGTFREFIQKPFQNGHTESVIETWLEANPGGVVEDGKLLFIGRQVNTDLGGWVDLLALDKEGNTVVIELKRDRTPRDTIAQALEYASFVEGLDAEQLEEILREYVADETLDLAEYHREYFDLSAEDAVSLNKDQRIVVVGQRVTEEIRQTARFLRSKRIRVTCLEFTFFESDTGERLLSTDIVVGREPITGPRVRSQSLPLVTREQFLASLDENGSRFFTRLLEFADSRTYPIHWGTRGFSMNVDVGGSHVALCYCYPPQSVFRQSLYTAFYGSGGLVGKVGAPDDMVEGIRESATATGLFVPAGREVRLAVDRAMSDAEMRAVQNWLDELAGVVRQCVGGE